MAFIFGMTMVDFLSSFLLAVEHSDKHCDPKSILCSLPSASLLPILIFTTEPLLIIVPNHG